MLNAAKAAVIPNPNFQTQPALEAMLGGTGSAFCSGAPSVWGSSGTGVAGALTCTQAAAWFDQLNGNPFWPSHGAGALWTLLEPNFSTGLMTLANSQVGSLDWSGSFTYPNSHSSFLPLHSPPNRAFT